MPTNKFHFKQFSVSHSASAMKVGVDGVLAASWATSKIPKNGTFLYGLDMGCGCGVMALIIKQKLQDSKILGIDIDKDAAEEASDNFQASPWKESLIAIEGDIKDFCDNQENHNRFDFIISNPPFYSEDVLSGNRTRDLARHQDTLSPESVIRFSASLLKDRGLVFFICPFSQHERLLELDKRIGLSLREMCHVAHNSSKNPKRTLMMWQKGLSDEKIKVSFLFLKDKSGLYSDEYKELTQDYYLAM